MWPMARGSIQTKPQMVLTTNVTSEFQLFLDDIFTLCPRALYQRLHFDDVIPEDLRIADIRAALNDRGFQIVQDRGLGHSYDELQHLMLAKRAEGPVDLGLWVYIRGKHYSAEREAQLQGRDDVCRHL